MYMDDQFPKENFDAGASNAGYSANQVVQINHAGGAYGDVSHEAACAGAWGIGAAWPRKAAGSGPPNDAA